MLALAASAANAQSVATGSALCNFYQDGYGASFADTTLQPAFGNNAADRFYAEMLTGITMFDPCGAAAVDMTPAANTQYPLAAVPETSAWVMLLAGLAVLAIPRGRKSDTFS